MKKMFVAFGIAFAIFVSSMFAIDAYKAGAPARAIASYADAETIEKFEAHSLERFNSTFSNSTATSAKLVKVSNDENELQRVCWFELYDENGSRVGYDGATLVHLLVTSNE